MSVDLSRVRRPVRGFGWVDHLIVNTGLLAAMGQVEVVVYLVLCVVADKHGVSWYRPETLARHVHHPPDRVRQAIGELARLGLIAVQDRYFQVLELKNRGQERPPAGSAERVNRSAERAPAVSDEIPGPGQVTPGEQGRP